MSNEQACRAVGINPKTARRWRNRRNATSKNKSAPPAHAWSRRMEPRPDRCAPLFDVPLYRQSGPRCVPSHGPGGLRLRRAAK
ncbi:hypothetical protein ACFYTC_19110 [Actinomadura nitritigenes]|uniref:hypothetical protein n=1 Tax=Actinomadura nitritigenes TaxID=134602 RepID=UPI0036AE29D0